MAWALKVVITDHAYMNFENEIETFKAYGAELVIAQCTSADEVIELAHDADVLINSDLPIPRKVIEALPNLKLITRYGIGVDHIDVEAATKHGIYVTNVPDYCQVDVADHALALILSLSQKVVQLNEKVKQGSWNFSDGAPHHRLQTQTVGLISYGGIARILSKKLQAIGFTVIAYDPYLINRQDSLDVELVSLETLMGRSDVISVHAPLVKATHHLIDREMLALTKPHAILINAGRGAVINEAHLIEALQNGVIAAAGLDVLEIEPIEKDHPFLTMEQVVLTPHFAFYSEQSMNELQEKTKLNVIAILEGKIPPYVVNPFVNK